ncbi:MAG TPA: acetylglutamate kinase [Candidatus Dormibacteraeota bacterium]|jgi:acetylglutamate kinase|nr:acetylglutamate kinase [Candidatus Dormibacteraeota bacterium]
MKIVVKLGGVTLDNPELLHRAAQAIKQLASEHQVAVVHGGGTALTRILTQVGKTSEFIDGLRVTDAETRDFAVMVLAGHMNKKLVAALGSIQQPAMGLCGGDGMAFRARKKTPNGHDLGYVGEISSVDPRWIETIWQQGSVPVISSVALGHDGQYYNVNADQMASACAVACHAHALIFLTDVSGVKDADGLVIRWLNLDRASELTQQSVIFGGMLPKLEACKQALLQGVNRVRILPAAEVEILPEFYFSKIEFGTEVSVA